MPLQCVEALQTEMLSALQVLVMHRYRAMSFDVILSTRVMASYGRGYATALHEPQFPRMSMPHEFCGIVECPSLAVAVASRVHHCTDAQSFHMQPCIRVYDHTCTQAHPSPQAMATQPISKKTIVIGPLPPSPQNIKSTGQISLLPPPPAARSSFSQTSGVSQTAVITASTGRL